ncbi:MAG: AIR synthase-related protein, partial [Dongia sp.]
KAGDVVLGLASSGVHSNGYSLVRKVVAVAGLDYAKPAPFASGSVGQALLTPTRIYVKSCLAAIRSGGVQGGGVKALAHITGGGLLENIPRVLPPETTCAIDGAAWPFPPVFAWLRRTAGIDAQEMARTFNCGIGMVLVVDPARVAAVRGVLEGAGETVFAIGTIEPKRGSEPGCRVTHTEKW